MKLKRVSKPLVFFFGFFFLLLANSCREKDSWEDYAYHENINELKAVTTLPSGEIVVVAYIKHDGDSKSSIVLVKYLENGLIDPGFGEQGIVITDYQLSSFESLTCKVVITNEGNIIFTESITPERGEWESSISQYSSEGNIDNTFGNMGIKKYKSVAIHSLELMENGNILISGAKYFETSSHKSFFVSQLNQTGQEIAEFGSEGEAIFDFNAFNTTCNFQKIQEDGKVLLVGNTDENHNIIPMLRLNPSGSLDTTFSGDGKVLADIGSSLSNNTCINDTEDDKYILLSITEDYDLLFARINQNGSLDNEFGLEGISIECCPANINHLRSVFPQNNGNFLILGRDTKNIIIADIQPNGELNNAFGENGTTSNSHEDLQYIKDLSVIKNEGKIIVTGKTIRYDQFVDQETFFFIMLFDEDGSIENSFGDNGVVISDI